VLNGKQLIIAANGGIVMSGGYFVLQQRQQKQRRISLLSSTHMVIAAAEAAAAAILDNQQLQVAHSPLMMSNILLLYGFFLGKLAVLSRGSSYTAWTIQWYFDLFLV
jgi:hypothetical protein